jgi:hypothetical protein
LGAGLIFNIFAGVGLVGTGASLIIGDTSAPDLARAAAQAWPNLVANLIALVVYRTGLVAASTALGVLVARALITGRRTWLWLAMAINTVAGFIYACIGLAPEAESLTASLVIIVVGGAISALALRWLFKQALASPPDHEKNQKRARAAAETR